MVAWYFPSKGDFKSDRLLVGFFVACTQDLTIRGTLVIWTIPRMFPIYNVMKRRPQMFVSRISFCFVMMAALFAFAGCALTKEEVKLMYEPGSASKLQGAESIKIKVEVVDFRSVKDKVSCKKNAYGMEMAPIVAVNDVSELISSSIEKELANRGFIISGEGLLLK